MEDRSPTFFLREQMNTYETWIRKTEEDLQEAISDAENANWHHMANGTVEARAYGRLLTWISEIVVRRERYDARR